MKFRYKKRKICGARNRKGNPCACKMLYRNGRCKYHGGLSTGPKTPEGRARALLNLKQYAYKAKQKNDTG